MKRTIVQGDLIPFTAEDVLKSLGMPPTHRFSEKIGELLEKTKDIAAPKAFYMEYPIETRSEKAVKAGELCLHSDGLARNAKDSAAIYPFLCTCGRELADFAETLTDVTDVFAFDAIMEFYCKLMLFRLREQLRGELPAGLVPRCDYPGDLGGWEIRELRKLFDSFGDAAAEIGVSLSEYYLMVPLKTVAGVFYGVKETQKDCAVCAAPSCPRRESPYSEQACLSALYRI